MVGGAGSDCRVGVLSPRAALSSRGAGGPVAPGGRGGSTIV